MVFLLARAPESHPAFQGRGENIMHNIFADEVAAFTALSGLIRGWGNYYAYAARISPVNRRSVGNPLAGVPRASPKGM